MKIKANCPTIGEWYLYTIFFTLFLLFLNFGITLQLKYISIPFKISSALFDSSLIAIICMFLRRKWLYIAIPIPFIISFVLWANVLYYRNFGDLIQASSYIRADITDPTVSSGGISSIKWQDIAFIILPFFPLGYAIANRKRLSNSSINSFWRWIMFSIFIMSFAFSYIGVIRRVKLHNRLDSYEGVAEILYVKETTSWITNYEMHHFIGYILKCMVSVSDIGKKLSPSDIAFIKSHISAHPEHRTDRNISMQLRSVKGKNLIMIIVESFPYKIFEMKEADELIPEMMKVANDSASIISKSKILADYGRSADAQFIYNTGLLPLRREAFVDFYALNNYPSLAKALSYPSMEIIGENKRLWVHFLTTKSYGFDILKDNIAPDCMNQDSIIFNYAKKEIPLMKSPFFLFITSISMHDPYDKPKVTPASDTLPISTNDARDKEYYQRLRHFDKNLGNFIAYLKENGIYDDSVIVILGDHEIRASKISQNLHDEYVPFIIANSPIPISGEVNTTQLDVFPTIMDIMGCRYKYLGQDYAGLGQSIFSSAGLSGIEYTPTDTDYRVSEMIIKGLTFTASD
ncbi:MAG: sulfatase-like hydrolase/transferase [Muribaculaceae bacterium]|nr:sulfatase-like hydrolase/transferase [Muribaculaceae bacterium]